MVKQEIIDNFDHILSEHGNTFIALRRVKWTEDSDPKLDLRKYVINQDGSERMMKGCSFDDKTADELTKVLVDTGYGDTNELLDSLKQRPDFNQELMDAPVDDKESEEFLIAANVSRKKRKKVIDQQAAVRILQYYLDAQKNIKK